MKRFVDYKNDCNRVRDSKERQKTPQQTNNKQSPRLSEIQFNIRWFMPQQNKNKVLCHNWCGATPPHPLLKFPEERPKSPVMVTIQQNWKILDIDVNKL